MNESIWVLLISLGSMLGGVVIGSWLRKRLPEHHLTDPATGIIKSGVGLISTLAALILGLLISTAKISFDSTATQVNEITADLVLLDQLLATYGPPSQELRQVLRDKSATLADRIWSQKGSGRPKAFVASDDWKLFFTALDQLPNSTDQQRNLRREIDDSINRGAQARLRLFAEAGGALPTPFLALLILWLTIIFASYSFLGAINPTVMVFVFLFALSSAGGLNGAEP
jgi:hypothetical protein